ncbi:unnamed protein product, partial [Polarella glacialis]
VWPWLAMQDSLTYGAVPDSFQGYLHSIIHDAPVIDGAGAERTGRSPRSVSVPKANITLECPIIQLPGVGQQSAELLSAAGVQTVADL